MWRYVSIFFLSVTIPLAAQDNKEAKKLAEAQRKEAEELAKQDARFKVDYDKFKDSTVVRSGWTDLNSEKNRVTGVNFLVGCQYKGEGAKGTPEYCFILFDSYSKSWRFRHHHDLTILIDGQRQDFGSISHIGSTVRGQSVLVVESMYMSISPELLEKIATAQKLEMKLGAYEYFFTPGNFAVFKALSNRLKSQ